MHVNQILNEARKRLKTIGSDALLTDAANALSILHVELVVVCDANGKAVGVLTKADVVRRIGHCQGAACRVSAAAAMTREMVSCHPEDHLSEVWSKMKQHGLRHIPVVDEQLRPIGIINARDTLQALLTNTTQETELLKEYLMSVGYH
jgi:CBS domain-containing protein